MNFKIRNEKAYRVRFVLRSYLRLALLLSQLGLKLKSQAALIMDAQQEQHSFSQESGQSNADCFHYQAHDGDCCA